MNYVIYRNRAKENMKYSGHFGTMFLKDKKI